MSGPTFIEIDGKRLLWRDLVKWRREQLAAAKRATQPALFELRHDPRPKAERTAAGPYHESSLFTLLDAQG